MHDMTVGDAGITKDNTMLLRGGCDEHDAGRRIDQLREPIEQ